MMNSNDLSQATRQPASASRRQFISGALAAAASRRCWVPLPV